MSSFNDLNPTLALKRFGTELALLHGALFSRLSIIRKDFLMKSLWFFGGLFCGLMLLSISKASVPPSGKKVSDTVVSQRLSEINVKKEAKVDFDSDIRILKEFESQGKYLEKLPALKKI